MPNLHTFTDQLVVRSEALINAITAASANGTTTDTQGYERAAALFYAAPSGVGTTVDCKLQDGNASNGSDMADVSGGALPQQTTLNGTRVYVQNINLNKRKRYIRHVVTGAGASAAGQYMVLLLLFNGDAYPVSQEQTVSSV